GTVSFNVDNVNLVLSHSFNAGESFQFKPFGGVGSAYLKQNITTTYTGRNFINVNFSNTVNNRSEYRGIGPRMGFDMSALVNDHFSIVTEMAGSLLVGSLKSNTNFTTQGAENPTPVNTALANISQTKVVP